MVQTIFDKFHNAIIETVEHRRTKKPEKLTMKIDGGSGASGFGGAESGDSVLLMHADKSIVNDPPVNHGKLLLDATVAEQVLCFPTSLRQLNEARGW